MFGLLGRSSLHGAGDGGREALAFGSSSCGFAKADCCWAPWWCWWLRCAWRGGVGCLVEVWRRAGHGEGIRRILARSATGRWLQVERQQRRWRRRWISHGGGGAEMALPGRCPGVQRASGRLRVRGSRRCPGGDGARVRLVGWARSNLAAVSRCR